MRKCVIFLPNVFSKNCLNHQMSKNPLKHSLTMHVGQFDILSLSSFEIPAHCIKNLCGRHLFLSINV